MFIVERLLDGLLLMFNQAVGIPLDNPLAYVYIAINWLLQIGAAIIYGGGEGVGLF